MHAAIRNPVVVGTAQVERVGCDKPRLSHERIQQHCKLAADVPMRGAGHRRHVVLALPDFVIEVLAQGLPPLQKCFELC